MKELRRLIDESLEAFLSSTRDGLSKMAPQAAPILDEVARATFPGGKRLRPVLCYWGYRGGGGEHGAPILKASASLELLHTFALLHDDVMDAASLRRGEPTPLRRIAEETGRKSFGLSISVLAGDLAFALSDLMFTASGFGPEPLARAFSPLNTMRLQAAAGQYLDLVGTGAPPEDVESARRAMRLKTASYSVEGPLAVGAALAGAHDPVVSLLSRYGSPLGEAFGLTDELLGLFGEAAQTGKDADTDLRRGTPTVLIAEAFARAVEGDREVLRGHWGNPSARETEMEAVRSVVRSSGALDAVLESIDRLAAEAVEAIGQPPGLPEEPSAALREIAERSSAGGLRLT
ncbi:MAG: polyprenyl synthetase family protein [Actinomycetota bacterium]